MCSSVVVAENIMCNTWLIKAYMPRVLWGRHLDFSFFIIFLSHY